MEKVVLIRYGEVWLKSDPVRRHWEHILAGNIKPLFPKGAKIHITPGRILVSAGRAPKGLSKVFGIVSYSEAAVCNKEILAIRKASRDITSKWKSGTFAIRARRTDKSFPMTSKELEIAMAEPVSLKVDLSDPDHELFIEIRDAAYVYEKSSPGPGGLPVGTAGKVVAYLRDDIDLAAAWLMMKRGALPVLIKPKPAFLKVLEKWAIGKTLKSVASVAAAKKFGALALIDSKSLKLNEKGLAILNPLPGFSDKELSALLKKIRS